MSLTKVTYSMIEGAGINVLDYGADPTGALDSLAAIQAAINVGKVYSQFNTTGKKIYLPAGRYKVSNSIDLTTCNGVHLVGEGRQATEIFTVATTPVIVANGSSTDVLNNTSVQNMTIRGGGSTNLDADGIRFSWGNACQFLNLTMFSCRNAFNLSHQYQSDLQNIKIYGAGVDSSYIGVYMGVTDLTYIDNAVNCYNVIVQSATNIGFRIVNGQGSKFVACEAGGFPMIYGWYIGEPDSGTIKNEWMFFVNCLADSVSAGGWVFRQGTASTMGQMQLSNCWSSNCQDGFFVEGGQNINFTNLLAIGNARSGITLSSSQKIIVTDANFLLNNEEAGAYGDIMLQNSNFNTIVNNVCDTAATVGLI